MRLLANARRFVAAPQLLAAAVCLLASVLVVACGSSSKAARGVATPAASGLQNLVTANDIAHAGSSTPKAALLEWFQAVQYRDYASVLALTSGRVRRSVGAAALHYAVRVVGYALGKPSIQKVVAHGDTVSVQVLVLSFVPNKPTPVLEEPATFSMIKGPVGWLLDDATYLLQSAQAMSAAARRGSRSAAGGT